LLLGCRSSARQMILLCSPVSLSPPFLSKTTIHPLRLPPITLSPDHHPPSTATETGHQGVDSANARGHQPTGHCKYWYVLALAANRRTMQRIAPPHSRPMIAWATYSRCTPLLRGLPWEHTGANFCKRLGLIERCCYCGVALYASLALTTLRA